MFRLIYEDMDGNVEDWDFNTIEETEQKKKLIY